MRVTNGRYEDLPQRLGIRTTCSSRPQGRVKNLTLGLGFSPARAPSANVSVWTQQSAGMACAYVAHTIPRNYHVLDFTDPELLDMHGAPCMSLPTLPYTSQHIRHWVLFRSSHDGRH